MAAHPRPVAGRSRHSRRRRAIRARPRGRARARGPRAAPSKHAIPQRELKSHRGADSDEELLTRT